MECLTGLQQDEGRRKLLRALSISRQQCRSAMERLQARLRSLFLQISAPAVPPFFLIGHPGLWDDGRSKGAWSPKEPEVHRRVRVPHGCCGGCGSRSKVLRRDAACSLPELPGLLAAGSR
ncbi:hypothetical protein NDU88_000982 [Pleurodeles waltl]|uniref:Uncharacterized protein n=1 Tax=Pleurodeles waltl TaxID=8319 RepID=A0AAV7R8W9_PLEWA|nr:hypothetical protein NDU88_000982 [Pleurodeles waltl]